MPFSSKLNQIYNFGDTKMDYDVPSDSRTGGMVLVSDFNPNIESEFFMLRSFSPYPLAIGEWLSLLLFFFFSLNTVPDIL